MLANLGDFPVNTVIPMPFPAYDSAGGSVTITGLAVTDLECYKGTSMTQRASDNGFALMDTDGIDIDSITGIHGFSIDTSDNSDSGFYVAGGIYWLVVDAITVDSQTVRFIFYFTLGMRLYPTTIGRTLDVTAAGNAGIDWANVENPTATLNLSATTIKTATDVETDTADIQTRIPAALVDGRIDASAGAMAANVLTATAINDDALTAAKFAASSLDGKGNWNIGKTGYTLTAGTGLGNQTADITGNLSGSVGGVAGHTPQTGDTYALASGATGFAAIDTVVDGTAANLKRYLTGAT